MTPLDVLDTLKLGYAYDALPSFRPQLAAAGVGGLAMPEEGAKAAEPVAESTEQGQKLGAKPLRLSFKLNDAAKQHVNRLAAPKAAGADKAGGQLTIRGIKAEKSRGSIILVYLNLAEGATPPGIKDPHYAGSITLFRHEHGDMGADATLSITDALQDLRKAGLWKEGDDLSVTLVQRRSSEKKESTPEIPFDKVTLDVAR